MIKDNNERLIKCYGNDLGVGSNNRVEAMATCWGIKRLKELNFQKIILEGDSKLIVRILNGEVDGPWEIRKMMEESKTMLGSLLQSKVSYI